MDLIPGYKLTEVGIIPEDWEVAVAAQLCECVVDCKNRTPPVVDGDEFAVVRTPNVRNGRFVREDLRFTDHSSFVKWTTRAIPQVGDILITREAPLGEVCPVPSDLKICLGQRMMLYRPDRKRIQSNFLLYVLMSSAVRSNLLKKIGGSTVGHAKVDDIRNLQIPIPPTKAEQQAIAEALSDVDILIESLEQLIAKKRCLKQGAMQKLLRPRDDWGEDSLGNLFNISCGRSKSSVLQQGGKYVVMDMGSVSPEGKILLSKRTDVEGDLLNRGDLVMPKDDIGGGQIIGKVAFIDCDGVYVLGDHVYKLQKLSSRVDSRFFYYLINSQFINPLLKKKVSGSAQLGLGKTSVLEQKAAFPDDLSDQIAIASVLSAIDAEIAALDTKLTKARQLKQGMMHNLLTGRIRLV